MTASGDGLLVLEDGASYRGRAIGARGTFFGEIVFNTSMTGFQEVLTDPSYRGQLVLMTAAHVGNYGARSGEEESGRVQAAGFLARDFPERWSGTGGELGLADMLARAGVPGLCGFDTRSLVRKLRSEGVMRAGISTEIEDPAELCRRVLESPPMEGSALALTAGTAETYRCPAPDGARFRVAAVDYGMKMNLCRLLNAAGCDVTVFPARATRSEILAESPDGVFLSNGPGDPAALSECVETVRSLVGERPIFGVCLGHQILGRALGASTFKLKFGHRGGNHPVQDLDGHAIAITSQNHGFAVDPAGLPAGAHVSHVNLNDGTVEGFRDPGRRILAVQYHPEGAPGPHDARGLFAEFLSMMEG
ncbi:MAG TPA: glutamine-hydrolyzing carbamoyl-phosphate synthase small subunit [Thermoanaerobaculia bacterium]|nr:glutamine-hydrolyzing carbamoyl-phosphate synthase small subunit [Thermoanaerobaculia bacterium]